MPQTQNPWEIDYATPAPPPQGKTKGSAQLEATLGPEPVIPLGRPAKPSAAAPAAAPAVPNPWEVDYEPPAQPGALQRAGSAFAESSGLTLLRDLIGGASRDPVRAERSKQALGAVIQGLAAEPGRWWGEMSALGQAMVNRDLPGMAYHAAGAVPLLGPGAQQVGQDVDRGDYASAVGHTGGLLAPMLIGPGATAAGRGTVTAGRFMRGAVGPAIKTAGESTALNRAILGTLLGGPKGAAIGVLTKAVPVIRAGVRGGRAAVAEAAAAAAEEAAQRAAAATAAREAADAALAHQANVYEMGERIRQPFPTLELPPAQSTQMPPAGTYADEVRVQDLGPQPVAPEPPAPAPAAPAVAYPDVTLESLARGFGKPLSRMNQSERANLQSIYDRIQHPLPVEQPTAAERQILTPAEKAAPTAELQYNAPEAQPPQTASAAQQLAEELRAEMERSGTLPPAEPAPVAAPEPAKPTPEQAARGKKVDALFDAMVRNKMPLEMVQQFGDKEWGMLAKHAGVNPPSETTIQQLTKRLSDYEAAQNVPVTPGMSTESAQQAFEQAQAVRGRKSAPKEPWEVRKADLIPYQDTVPRPKVAHDTSGGYSEAEMNSRALRNRNAETEPPDVTRHPVGSWGIDPTGELMQLREYSLDDPRLVFTEDPGRNQTVRKYIDWIEQGHEPPPLRALEMEKGGIKIQEGNHRVAAIRATGGDKVRAWVTVTHNRPIGQGQVMPEGVTHAGAIKRALAEGKKVPPEVLADYPELRQ